MTQHARNFFFSEEKKQKTFIFFGCVLRQHTLKETKVFWFFFSKKNCFLSLGSANA